MTDDKSLLIQIGEEFDRVLKPVYTQLDRIEHTLGEHTGKIDSLTGDMIQVQFELGVIKDDLKEVKEDVSCIKTDMSKIKDNHVKELNEVREHIGLPQLTHQKTV